MVDLLQRGVDLLQEFVYVLWRKRPCGGLKSQASLDDFGS
jgi:hypothetical protein